MFTLFMFLFSNSQTNITNLRIALFYCTAMDEENEGSSLEVVKFVG